MEAVSVAVTDVFRAGRSEGAWCHACFFISREFVKLLAGKLINAD